MHDGALIADSGPLLGLALGLKCTGAAGVLVRAKKMGLVDQVHPLLLSMRKNGYYISESVVQAACGHTGE